MAQLEYFYTREGLAYLLIGIALAIILHGMLLGDGKSSATNSEANNDESKEEEEEKDPPRNFTMEQLRKFNGVVMPETSKFDLDAGKIHICIKGNVYDVTSAADFYGPEGGYHLFAGRDASRALAKLSFEEADLAQPQIDDLSFAEKDQLGDWEAKFEMKRYPIVGRLCTPAACEKQHMSLEELAKFDGSGEAKDGRVDPPLYVGCKGKVYDMSFGGFDMYKPGTTYNCFAGKDASKALAKMSFAPEDLNSRDLSDLTAEQKKVLDDWADKFENKRKYPIVGTLKPYVPSEA